MHQEGAPVALQEVSPVDLHSHAVDLQLFPQEWLLVEEVTPREYERLAVCQGLTDSSVPDLPQDAISCRYLQHTIIPDKALSHTNRANT